MSFTVSLAGIRIRIEPLSPRLQNRFRDFSDSGEPNIHIRITKEMITAESEIRRVYSEAFRPGFSLSEALTEESAVCRAISEKLPELGAFLLHGSAIEYDGEGIVFVASSGTGKSTFARSWAACFPDRVQYINDDKPFVRVKDGCATIYGSPWNGKHRLGDNRSAPLKAICLLERSETNRAEKVSALEVLPQLLSHLYIPSNPVGRSALFSILQKLSSVSGFYRVGCNPDPDAALPCKEVIFPS